MLHEILFFVFAGVCVAGALNLILQKHPINSALSLIVVMGSLAVLYLLLGAEFVAAVQVIVYAGAIMVLFVFTIMLLNAGEEEHTPGNRVAMTLGAPSIAVIVGIVAWVISKHGGFGDVNIGGQLVTSEVGNTTAVARLLFRDFLLPFEVTSVLILIAILGAVVLARREHQ